ncbi:hypothetical protein [Aliidiomarina quisquiliarum]|uniref:hypothetical protein n=1 Tax=Aliidiomarina quisquiliarum TaxID=2938947 RepID=UPI00208FF0FF|nr:hypothetical protein [Aliidiomarina quisquiliarum]MCO4320022.1 hypothetical protein [Aliidiomarina quisquiliarum]
MSALNFIEKTTSHINYVDLFVEFSKTGRRKGKKIYLNEAPNSFLTTNELKNFGTFDLEVVGVFMDADGTVTHEDMYDSPLEALEAGASDVQYHISGRAKEPYHGNPWYPLHQVTSLVKAEEKISEVMRAASLAS